jgi:hypothetical protein
MIVASEGFNNYRFGDLSKLKSGMYLVSLIYRAQKITQKLIKE